MGSSFLPDVAAAVVDAGTKYGHDIDLQESLKQALQNHRTPDAEIGAMLAMLDTLDPIEPRDDSYPRKRHRDEVTAELAFDSINDLAGDSPCHVRELRFVSGPTEFLVNVTQNRIFGRVQRRVDGRDSGRVSGRSIELDVPHGKHRSVGLDRSGHFLFRSAPAIFRLRLRSGLRTDWILH